MNLQPTDNLEYPEFIDSLKYSVNIKALIDRGVRFENNIVGIESDFDAYRYAHDQENINNHKPVYIINPQRQVRPTERLSCSGFALSCFDTFENAETLFEKISKTVKNFHKTVGNAIVTGSLNQDDGVLSPVNGEGHFDLYEFSSCDLGSKFTISKILA